MSTNSFKIGDPIQVTVKARIDSGFIVEPLHSEKTPQGYWFRLRKPKDEKAPNVDDVVTARVIDVYDKQGVIDLSIDDRGFRNISDKMRPRYIKAISSLLNAYQGGQLENLDANDISEVKGMFNRQIRHDQQDWFQVALLFGQPSRFMANKVVTMLVELRTAVLAADLLNYLDRLELLKSELSEELLQDVLDKLCESAVID